MLAAPGLFVIQVKLGKLDSCTEKHLGMCNIVQQWQLLLQC